MPQNTIKRKSSPTGDTCPQIPSIAVTPEPPALQMVLLMLNLNAAHAYVAHACATYACATYALLTQTEVQGAADTTVPAWTAGLPNSLQS
jgi:hypothetical protein